MSKFNLTEYPVILKAMNGDGEALSYLKAYDPNRLKLMTVEDLRSLVYEPEEWVKFQDRLSFMMWKAEGEAEGQPQPVPELEAWQKGEAFEEAKTELWYRQHVETSYQGKPCKWGDVPNRGPYKVPSWRARSNYLFDWYAMTDEELKEWLEKHKDWAVSE